MATHAHTTPDRRPATPPGTGGRRRLAAGLAALALIAPACASVGIPGPQITAHPDEALLRLGERLVRSVIVEKAAWRAAEGEMDDNGPHTLAAMAQLGRNGAIVDAIERQVATTHAGLIVKLRAVMWCQNGPRGFDRDGCTDDRVMAGLMDDLAAMDVTMWGAW